MINLTDKPVSVDGLTIDRLRQHIDAAFVSLEREVGSNPNRTERHKLARAEGVVAAVNRNDDPQAVVQSLCEIADGKARVDDHIAQSSGCFNFKPRSDNQYSIRAFCRKILYFAWCGRDVLLPVNFKMTKSVSPEMRAESPSPVLKALAIFEPEEAEIKKFGNHLVQWMTQYSLSWIYCTDWLDFADIDLSDAAHLHVFMSNHNISKKGNPSSVEKAVMIFAGRGYLTFNAGKYGAAKDAAYHSLSQKRLASKDTNAFIAPGKRSGQSCFYLLPQLEVDGFAPSAETIRTWDKLFASYIAHREQTGRSANEKKKSALHLLADYIAIALPTFAMHSSEPIDMPVSPRKFTRYPFVDQTYRSKSFPTYLEYLKKRGLAKSTQKTNLYVILDFFQWVELNLATEDFADIAGPGFQCPLHRKDFPFVPRATGTDKIPFTEEVYPLLFLYIHEVERIGMYLEARPKVARRIGNFTDQASNHVIDLRSLDDEFNISYQDNIFRITQIPQRLIVGGNRASMGVNLSTLRLLSFIIETGQRGQNAQWLDSDKWARHLHHYSDKDPIKLIHINTDKAGKTFDIRVLSRVVDMLLRQQDHRAAKRIPKVAVDYEGRASSPFEPIVPLFANEDGSTIADNAYAIVWSDLMIGLQGFLHENGIEFKPVTNVKPPDEFDRGQSGADGPICELKWSPVHTPHAARSSFVSRRAGSTDYVILAELIGHNDPIVTAYYDAAKYEDIVDVLRHKNRPALDASSPLSELRSQLTSPDYEKEDVIRRFGISSLRDIHDSESRKDAKGIELLKTSQASELVFRDTHICVAGEMCPDDVILAAGAPMRCGTCKLACKSVDHLPAIEAKCRALTARIQATSAALMREKDGRRDQAHLKRLQGDLTADSYQLVGWQDASAMLRRLLEEQKPEGVVAGSPDIIKLHLERVVRQVKPAQFLVDRIVDAKMYPSMSDEVLQRQASRLARKLAMTETQLLADENEEVMALYSYINTRLKALGKTWDEAGKIIEQDVGNLLDDKKSAMRLLNAGS